MSEDPAVLHRTWVACGIGLLRQLTDLATQCFSRVDADKYSGLSARLSSQGTRKFRKEVLGCLTPIVVLGCAGHIASTPESSLLDSDIAKLCKALVESEELAEDTRVFMPASTTPVFNMFSVHLLYGGLGLTPAVADEDDRLDKKLEADFVPRRIDLSGSDLRCNWSSLGQVFDRSDCDDGLLLELSGAVYNPFSEDSTYGMFVRLSLCSSGQGAAWYWTELRSELGGIKPSTLAKLPLDVD